MTSDIIADNGYVIIAVNQTEYRQAQCCAYTIKSKMPGASVTLIVPTLKTVAKKYLDGFDAVTELPFKKHTTCRQNDWQLYWASPYNNTIAIDCKSLVKVDHTSLWDYLVDHHDIAFPTQIHDFRQNVVNPKYQLQLNKEYNINIMYSNMFFFKRSDIALAHFKLADVYFQHWKDVFALYVAPQHVPDLFDADIMHSLVATHTGNDVTCYHDNILTYVDMKLSRVGADSNWTDRLNVWSSAAGKIKIQNYAINSTIYYYDNEFLTDEIFDEQQQHYTNVTK